MTDTASLAIRALTAADEPAVLKLLEKSLAGGPTGERTADFLRWKHFDNPFGRSIGLVATDGGQLAGVRLVMRWGFDVGGRRISAGRMVDTATDPAYRGRGIFRDLTTAALEIAQDDIALIFNTPNASSRPGYLSLGWDLVGTIPTSLRPVRPVRMALGLRGALHRHGSRMPLPQPDLPPLAELLNARGDAVRQLLAARTPDPLRLSTPLTAEVLRWRFIDVPGLDYRAVPAFRDGKLVGLGIGRLRHRGALAELTLAEILHAEGDVAAATSILRNAAHHSGADHVATHVATGSSTAAALRRAGYLTTGRIGLTLTSKALAPLAVDPRDMRSWALSLGDIEVF
jgi:GNAT superfamily N-acetyltransferase